MDASKPEVISLTELETALMHDLDLRDASHTHHETLKDKAECGLFLLCLVISITLMMLRVFTNLIPLMLGLPSGRVIVMRFLNK